MSSLSLRYEDCVRTRATTAVCKACHDTCPTGAIALDGPRASVVVEIAKCVECGLCQAACPTEAFSSAFDVASFLATAPAHLRCGDGIPCVAALATEDLVTLVMRHKGLTLVADAGCKAGERAHAQLPARLAEVHAFLAAFSHEARVTLTHAGSAPAPADVDDGQPVSAGRRDFLKRLLPRPEATVEEPARLSLEGKKLDRERLRATRVPARRTRMLEVVGQPAQEPRACSSGEIGFTSSKRLDATTCTACMMCVNLCPTGALTSSRLHDEFRFSAAKCVKCHVCHDVCAPDALTLAPEVSLVELVAAVPQVLARLTIKRCGDCNALFKYEGGAALCPRCRALDDEAYELVGFKQ